MDLKLQLIKPFAYWMQIKKRIKIAFGGRGGGKSECIVRMLIVLSFSLSDCTFLFARETQKSIEYSSYQSLVDIIRTNDISQFFNITKTEVINKATNVKFIFVGLRECNITSVKSIYNIKICFIEEGQAITQGSWEILEPSIRADDAEIWWAFNPRKASDPVYQIVNRYQLEEKTFITDDKEYKYYEYEDDDYLITKINFDANYFFPPVLEKTRQMCLKYQPQLYSNIWLGELQRQQGKIFAESSLRFFNAEDYKNNLDIHYTKKAIIDPAFGRENCFTSCIIYSQIGKDFYIHDSGLMRADGIRTTDELLIDFLNRNNIREVMIEANFSQKELAKKLQRHFHVRPFYVKQNKIERIINASIPIREHVLFDDKSLTAPEINSIDEWIKNKDGRNFIAMMQLLDFSDIPSENNIQGDDFSYIDFPDCLASLVMYATKPKALISNKETASFNNTENTDINRQEIKDRIKTITNNKKGVSGFGFDR